VLSRPRNNAESGSSLARTQQDEGIAAATQPAANLAGETCVALLRGSARARTRAPPTHPRPTITHGTSSGSISRCVMRSLSARRRPGAPAECRAPHGRPTAPSPERRSRKSPTFHVEQRGARMRQPPPQARFGTPVAPTGVARQGLTPRLATSCVRPGRHPRGARRLQRRRAPTRPRWHRLRWTAGSQRPNGRPLDAGRRSRPRPRPDSHAARRGRGPDDGCAHCRLLTCALAVAGGVGGVPSRALDGLGRSVTTRPHHRGSESAPLGGSTACATEASTARRDRGFARPGRGGTRWLEERCGRRLGGTTQGTRSTTRSERPRRHTPVVGRSGRPSTDSTHRPRTRPSLVSTLGARPDRAERERLRFGSTRPARPPSGAWATRPGQPAPHHGEKDEVVPTGDPASR